MTVTAVWNSIRMEGIFTTTSIIFVKYLLSRQQGRDKAFDASYKTETTGYFHPTEHDFLGANRDEAIGYYPSSTEAIKGMLNYLRNQKMRLGDYSFVDLGCGKGKALVIASQYPFKSITGLEASTHLSAIARRNVLKFIGKRNCSSLTVINDDIFNYGFDDANLIVYVSNPFVAGSSLYQALAKKLEMTVSKFGRNIYLLTYTPANAPVFMENDSLDNVLRYTSVSDDHCWTIYKVSPKQNGPSTCA